MNKIIYCLLLLMGLLPTAAFAQSSNTATYKITFEATWSEQTHPWPNFPGNPHFSPLVGSAHNDNVVYWLRDGIATEGIERMAETGSTSVFQSEVEQAIAANNALNYIPGSGLVSPGQTTIESFEVSQDYPLVTFVSMLAPSPDWFVGVSGLSLLDENGNWLPSVVVELNPYDSGTDGGVDYTSSNVDTTPHEPIANIRGIPPFADAPIGTFTITRIDVPVTCSSALVQEAEAGILSGDFQIGNDNSASGGQYISVPSGAGGAGGVNGPDQASYCMTVETAGTYRLNAWAYTADHGRNSFHLQVDDQPANGYTWHIPVNPAYASYNVTSGGVPIELTLDPGEHTVNFFLRERGARLDKVELELVDDTPPPPPTCSDGLVNEGEAGALTGGFAVGMDALANGGAFAHVPNGYGNRSLMDPNESAAYCFTVATEGTYRIKTVVDAPNGGDDSFFVLVDDLVGESFKWHILNTIGLEERFVAMGGSTTPFEVSLTAGQHQVTFFLREDGVGLDQIELEFVGTADPLRIATDAGLNYTYYEVEEPAREAQNDPVVIETGHIQNFSLAPRYQDTGYALRYSGCLNIATAGEYTFFTQSDDDLRLSIGGMSLIESNGEGVMQEDSANRSLSQGMHEVEIMLTEMGGYRGPLQVSYQGPALEKQQIPDSALFVEGCSNSDADSNSNIQIFLPFIAS